MQEHEPYHDLGLGGIAHGADGKHLTGADQVEVGRLGFAEFGRIEQSLGRRRVPGCRKSLRGWD